MSNEQDVYSIQNLIDQPGGPIWLINTCEDVIEGGGDVAISIVVNGSSQMLDIPRTWIPIEATRTYARKYLLDSLHFSKAMASGTVTAISAAYAADLLSQPGAAEEQDRLSDYMKAQRNAITRRSIPNNVKVETTSADAGMLDTDVKECFSEV
jgi:hypothetical protein